MTVDFDQVRADLRHALSLAMDAAAVGQCDLDTVNAQILEANEEDVPWRERVALYVDEALLFQQQAELAGAVAQLALAIAGFEDDGAR